MYCLFVYGISEVISLAKTLLVYSSPEIGVLSFRPQQDVKIFSKSAGARADLWGVEINGKRGYVPKNLLRETKVFKAKLEFLVPTEQPAQSAQPKKETEKISPSSVNYEVFKGTTIYPDDVSGEFEATPSSGIVSDKIQESEKIEEETATTPTPEITPPPVQNVETELSNDIKEKSEEFDDEDEEEEEERNTEEEDEDDDEEEEVEEEESDLNPNVIEAIRNKINDNVESIENKIDENKIKTNYMESIENEINENVVKTNNAEPSESKYDNLDVLQNKIVEPTAEVDDNKNETIPQTNDNIDLKNDTDVKVPSMPAETENLIVDDGEKEELATDSMKVPENIETLPEISPQETVTVPEPSTQSAPIITVTETLETPSEPPTVVPINTVTGTPIEQPPTVAPIGTDTDTLGTPTDSPKPLEVSERPSETVSSPQHTTENPPELPIPIYENILELFTENPRNHESEEKTEPPVVQALTSAENIEEATTDSVESTEKIDIIAEAPETANESDGIFSKLYTGLFGANDNVIGDSDLEKKELPEAINYSTLEETMKIDPIKVQTEPIEEQTEEPDHGVFEKHTHEKPFDKYLENSQKYNEIPHGK